MTWRSLPGWLKGGIVLSILITIFNILPYFLATKGTISSGGEIAGYNLIGLYIILILSFILGIILGVIYGNKSILNKPVFIRGLFLGLSLTFAGLYLGLTWNIVPYLIFTKILSSQNSIYIFGILGYIFAIFINFLFGIIFSLIDEKFKIIKV